MILCVWYTFQFRIFPRGNELCVIHKFHQQKWVKFPGFFCPIVCDPGLIHNDKTLLEYFINYIRKLLLILNGCNNFHDVGIRKQTKKVMRWSHRDFWFVTISLHDNNKKIEKKFLNGWKKMEKPATDTENLYFFPTVNVLQHYQRSDIWHRPK